MDSRSESSHDEQYSKPKKSHSDQNVRRLKKTTSNKEPKKSRSEPAIPLNHSESGLKKSSSVKTRFFEACNSKFKAMSPKKSNRNKDNNSERAETETPKEVETPSIREMQASTQSDLSFILFKDSITGEKYLDSDERTERIQQHSLWMETQKDPKPQSPKCGFWDDWDDAHESEYKYFASQESTGSGYWDGKSNTHSETVSNVSEEEVKPVGIDNKPKR